MACTQTTRFNPQTFLTKRIIGTTSLTYPKKHAIYLQGETADAMFYIQAGQVKLTVVSRRGKEAVVAMLGCGAFVGESCLAGQTVRTTTATALEDSRLVRIDKDAMIRLLHEEPTFAELFLTHLLSRNLRIQEDLVDQLFNSSEKRLARVLLMLAHFGKDRKPKAVIPRISQEMLAEMIGTTRSRVSFFMNKFRNLGFIDYNGKMHANCGNGGLHVHRSLLNIALPDEVPHPFLLRGLSGAEQSSIQQRDRFNPSPLSNCVQLFRSKVSECRGATRKGLHDARTGYRSGDHGGTHGPRGLSGRGDDRAAGRSLRQCRASD